MFYIYDCADIYYAHSEFFFFVLTKSEIWESKQYGYFTSTMQILKQYVFNKCVVSTYDRIICN